MIRHSWFGHIINGNEYIQVAVTWHLHNIYYKVNEYEKYAFSISISCFLKEYNISTMGFCAYRTSGLVRGGPLETGLLNIRFWLDTHYIFSIFKYMTRFWLWFWNPFGHRTRE